MTDELSAAPPFRAPSAYVQLAESFHAPGFSRLASLPVKATAPFRSVSPALPRATFAAPERALAVQVSPGAVTTRSTVRVSVRESFGAGATIFAIGLPLRSFSFIAPPSLAAAKTEASERVAPDADALGGGEAGAARGGGPGG